MCLWGLCGTVASIYAGNGAQTQTLEEGTRMFQRSFSHTFARPRA